MRRGWPSGEQQWQCGLRQWGSSRRGSSSTRLPTTHTHAVLCIRCLGQGAQMDVLPAKHCTFNRQYPLPCNNPCSVSCSSAQIKCHNHATAAPCCPIRHYWVLPPSFASSSFSPTQPAWTRRQATQPPPASVAGLHRVCRCLRRQLPPSRLPLWAPCLPRWQPASLPTLPLTWQPAWQLVCRPWLRLSALPRGRRRCCARTAQ